MPSIGSVIGAGASIGGAILGSSAASDASQAQVEAAKLAIAEQQREYDLTRSDHMPWLTTGGSALDKLAGIYGLDTSVNGKTVPGTGMPDFSSFWKSPDYNIAMQQGLAGVDAGAAATGSLDSGAARKSEMRFASGLGSQQFNTYANRLAGIAGVGQTAADFLGNAGQNTANQISQQYGNIGNAQASAYLSQGQQYGNMLGGLAGMFGSAGANGLFGGSGSSGSNWIGATSPTGQSGSGIWGPW